MSKLGFSSSLFGFNKTEVNLYLEKVGRDYSEKIKEKNSVIADLQAQIGRLQKEKSDLQKDFEQAKQKADYYSGKEAEIEKMSVSIGTMYMVAKQNASEILNGAKAAAFEINEHSKKQLAATAEAGERLNAIKTELAKTSEDFTDNVAGLCESFSSMQASIEEKIERFNNELPEITVEE